jgi:hypothetical protein
VTLYDVVGLVGVATILAAYAATVLGALDAKRAPALALNFLGPTLILASLSQRFNLSAAIVEAAWALIALGGLVRIAMTRGRSAAEQGDQHR